MKISDLIIQLEQMQKEHGDLRVMTYEPMGTGVVDYRGVRIKDIRAKRKREYKTYYVDYSDKVSIEKVLHV
jgi:hypothetical protein